MANLSALTGKTQPNLSALSKPSIAGQVLPGASISQTKKTGLAAILDKLPKPVQDVASTVEKGLFGSQEVDLAGRPVQVGGLLRRGDSPKDQIIDSFLPFRLLLPKADALKVGQRLDALMPLIEEGRITKERAGEIAMESISPKGLEAVQKKMPIVPKKVELTDTERSALRPLAVEETLDKVFSALDIVTMGTIKPIARTAAEAIAKSKSASGISTILSREIPDLTPQNRTAFSRALVSVDNADDVQTVINRTNFALQEAGKAPPKEELKALFAPSTGAPATRPEPFVDSGDLTTKLLSKLSGKTTVSRQFISDLTNSPDLKQAEKDLIRKTLADEGDTIDIPTFANRVKSELLPLERNALTKSAPKHENITLPDELRGPVASYDEHIYSSPIKTSAGESHFSNAFSEEGRNNYFAHSRIEDLPSTSEEARRIGNTLSTGDKLGPENAGYDRLKDYPVNGSTRRVIEIQSDLFQKGRLEGEAEVPKVGDVSMLESRIESLKRGLQRTPEDAAEINREIARWEKELETARKSVVGSESRNAEIAKLEPYRNTWHERVIREEVKQAAKDGKTKLQFPTGETAMKIEGLGQTNTFTWKEAALRPEMLKVGMEVNQGANLGNGWIITDVLGDGKFKAVPKSQLDRYTIEKVGSEYKTKTPEGKYLSDIEGDFVFPSKEAAQKDLYDEVGAYSETFDISGKIDTNNPIYKFYDKTVAKYLKNKYGAKEVTDAQGVKWMEIDVKPEYGKAPVEAYGMAGGVEVDDEGNVDINMEGAILGVAAAGILRRAKLTPKQMAGIAEEAKKMKALMTSTAETPIEFALGKRAIQERYIRLEAEPLLQMMSDAKITQDDSRALFDAFERSRPLPVELTEKGGEAILAEGRRLNEVLTEAKLSREVIERAWDDDTYLKTILETTDGGRPTAEQIARLRNATSQNFKDQLITSQGEGAGKLKQKLQTKERQYRTADERDAVLEDFGLRTKRDFVAAFEENIRLTSKVTSNREFNDAVRDVARRGFFVKGGKLERRADISEVYDPVRNNDFRLEVKGKANKKIESIVDTIQAERLITESEARLLKDGLYKEMKDSVKTLKEGQDFAIEDIERVTSGFKDKIDALSTGLKAEKRALLDKKKELITAIRDEAKREINDFYGKIVIERGKLIDKDMRDLGSIRGAEPLRGIMVNPNDYRAVKEIVADMNPSSLEDFARAFKMVQATLDLFQIPQALRSSIAINGLLRGGWDWIKAVSTTSKVTTKELLEASEFVQLGRHKDFDIDLWNKTIKSVESEVSPLMKVLKDLGEKADTIPVLSQVKDFAGKVVGNLERYQWQTLMIPLKAKAWKQKYLTLKRNFPDVDERTLKIEAGRAVDDYFAGQNWDKLMARNPRMAAQGLQRAARILIFALDYLTSSLRTAKREYVDSFTPGVKGDIARKAVMRKVLYGLGTVTAISYMLNGKSSFENDDPNSWYKIQTPLKDGKGNPYYLDILGNWGQAWNLMNRPTDFMRGKISGPGKVATNFLAEGTLEVGDALNPIPFSWRNVLEAIYNAAAGKEAGGQMPRTIPEAALITSMEFMGLAGTFSGGKSKRQTLARMVRNETVTPNDFWRWITGQEVPTNKERVQRVIDTDGPLDAARWEVSQKKNGSLSENSFPTRDLLKDKYGIAGTITDEGNIKKIQSMDPEEQKAFLMGYATSTRDTLNLRIKSKASKPGLNDLFK